MRPTTVGPGGLYVIELRRLLSRRIVRILAALAILGIVIGGVATLAKSHRQTAPQLITQRQEQVEACLRGHDGPPIEELPAGPKRQEVCRQFFSAEQRDTRFRLEQLPGVARGVTVPLVLISILLGASFIGAEWRAGTVTTELTWEPRRIRLLVAKALAAVTVAIAFTLVVQVLLALALTPAAALRGSTAGFSFSKLSAAVLRGAVIAGVGAGIGFSIGAIGRNTAAALGASFVYLAILEGPLLGNFFPGLRRWLVVGNAIVFVSGRSDFSVKGRSPTAAGIILVIYAVGAVAIATAWFRARDVT